MRSGLLFSHNHDKSQEEYHSSTNHYSLCIPAWGVLIPLTYIFCNKKRRNFFTKVFKITTKLFLTLYARNEFAQVLCAVKGKYHTNTDINSYNLEMLDQGINVNHISIIWKTLIMEWSLPLYKVSSGKRYISYLMVFLLQDILLPLLFKTYLAL